MMHYEYEMFLNDIEITNIEVVPNITIIDILEKFEHWAEKKKFEEIVQCSPATTITTECLLHGACIIFNSSGCNSDCKLYL
jgi:uncharacterized protein YlzI (FlbEa/FlbD family)